MRWHQIINERGEGFLYHATPSPDDAAKIIAQNILLARTEHRAEELGFPSVDGSSYIKGVSLSRDGMFADNWRASGNEHPSIVFVLDQRALRTRYRLRPYDYFHNRVKWSRERGPKVRSEAEEFCISQTGITPLDRFIVEVRMGRALHEICMRDDEDDYGSSDHPDSMYGPLTHHPKLKLI